MVCGGSRYAVRRGIDSFLAFVGVNPTCDFYILFYYTTDYLKCQIVFSWRKSENKGQIHSGKGFKVGFDGVMDGVNDSGGNGCKNEVL
jgi:hypothetical protein